MNTSSPAVVLLGKRCLL